ncbi:MAG: molybdate ABC transporter substrate-binding protein [Phycisphaerales bacterium]|nr:molybdate ABC transporter substrate-binding protein [Phycisphaerales bacterium]
MLLPAVALAAATAADPLTMFCAAGVRGPVEAVAEQWMQETGQRVQLQYGGSGTLLSSLRITPDVDLYLAASNDYLDQAADRGLIQERIPLASQRLVIAVPEGNPNDVQSLDDLLDGRLRVSLPDPKAAAAGRTAQRVLEAAGIWDRLQSSVSVTKPTVNEVALDVRLRAADAAICWDTTTRLMDGVDAISDPRLAPSRESVGIAVTSATRQPTQALRFARYLAARDKGLLTFADAGFTTVKGDVWAIEPRLKLFAGGMLRPAIEPIIKAFCQREGVQIDRSYNGCGILVAQMRSGDIPDAYAACDQEFLDMVQQHFEDGTMLSRNDLVLLVPAGNRAGLNRTEDLLKPGLRLGLASPQRSALGKLSVDALRAAGVMDALQDSGNVVVESPTGDFLVNQVRAGALDGAIVYRSNASATEAVREHTDIVEIDLPGDPARQPWTVRRNGDHANTLGRLLDRIVAARANGAFASLGFLPVGPASP